jgi:hypothetical protein
LPIKSFGPCGKHEPLVEQRGVRKLSQKTRPWQGRALLPWAFLAMLLGASGATLATATTSSTERLQK